MVRGIVVSVVAFHAVFFGEMSWSAAHCLVMCRRVVPPIDDDEMSSKGEGKSTVAGISVGPKYEPSRL